MGLITRVNGPNMGADEEWDLMRCLCFLGFCFMVCEHKGFNLVGEKAEASLGEEQLMDIARCDGFQVFGPLQINKPSDDFPWLRSESQNFRGLEG
jgi:hypothetical protein